MIRPNHIIALLILITFPLFASGQDAKNTGNHFNYGFRFGGESSMLMGVNANVNGHHFRKYEYENTSLLSGLASFIVRYNTDILYFQTELMYNCNRSGIKLELDNFIEEYSTPEVLIGEKQPQHYGTTTTILRSIDIPLFIGYNLSNSSIYHFSIFAGPKFKFLIPSISNSKFDGYPYTLSEEFRNFMMNMTIGIGCRIQSLFFDFMYDFGLTNISRSIRFSEQQEGTNVSLKRNVGYLTVSVGMLF